MRERENCTILTFLTCLKLFDFFPRKSFFSWKFLLLKYTYSLWRRLLNYNYYNSLPRTTLVKSSRYEKKRRKMRKKGIILSQNRCFYPAFGGFAPWNPHQGSVLDPLLGGSQPPQTPNCKRPSNFSLSHISILKSWQVWNGETMYILIAANTYQLFETKYTNNAIKLRKELGYDVFISS